jgi:hypothetical protein
VPSPDRTATPLMKNHYRLIRRTLTLSAILLTAVTSAQNWTPTTAPVTNWSCVVCSADGSRVVCGVGDNTYRAGLIYVSTNTGLGWTSNNAPALYWVTLSSSADGSRFFAGNLDQTVYRSTDTGAIWARTGAPRQEWWSVCSSGDGTRLVAGAVGATYTSTNSAVSWTSSPMVGLNTNDSVKCVASSACGVWVVAATQNSNPSFTGSMYISRNGGVTW